MICFFGKNVFFVFGYLFRRPKRDQSESSLSQIRVQSESSPIFVRRVRCFGLSNKVKHFVRRVFVLSPIRFGAYDVLGNQIKSNILARRIFALSPRQVHEQKHNRRGCACISCSGAALCSVQDRCFLKTNARRRSFWVLKQIVVLTFVLQTQMLNNEQTKQHATGP